MQYHPKLKKAISEIQSILEKHDIAGMVIIHTPGFSEYLYKVDTSYSVARLEQNHLRIRAKLDDYAGNKALRDKRITDTVNLIQHFQDTGLMLVKNTISVMDMLQKHLEIEKTGGSDTTHTTQNN